VTSTANDTSEFATGVGLASPYQVTNTTDIVPGSDVGSLRQVILNADTTRPQPARTSLSISLQAHS